MKAPTKEQLLADVLSNATWNEIAQKYGYSDPRFLRKLARRYRFLDLVAPHVPDCMSYKLGYTSYKLG